MTLAPTRPRGATARALPLLALLPLLSLLSACGDGSGGGGPSDPRAELVARLDSIVRDQVHGGPVASAAVAVVRGTDTLLLEAVGQRDRAGSVPAQIGTVYRVGSITKQFVAAAVMQEVEGGHVALGDPITKFLPAYAQWAGVTVQQLLDQTSGVPEFLSESLVATAGVDRTPEEIVALVAGRPLDFTPGTWWRYSNTNYILLGMILERVTGRAWAELTRERLLAPLGMTTAGMCPSETTDPSYAQGYELVGGQLVPSPYFSMTLAWAAGGLCMSVPDFLRWQEALTTGGVVTPASYARMATAGTLTDGRSTGYGFALVVQQFAGHRLIHHDGAILGFSAQQLWFPDDGLRVVVFENTHGGSTDTRADWLAANLARAVLGQPLLRRP